MADENNQQRLKVMQDIRSAHAEILRLTELEGKATQNQIDKYDVLDKALNNSRKEFVELNKQSKKLKLNLKKVGDAVAEDIQGPFNKLKGTLESLPLGNILSKVGKWDTKQKALGKSLEKTFKSGDIGVKNLAKGFGQVTKASGKMLGTLMGPLGMVALFSSLVVMAWNMDKAMGEFGKSMGVGTSKAKELSTISAHMNWEENQKAVQGITESFNGLLVTNKELVESVGDLSHKYGLSEAVGGKLLKNSIALGVSHDDITNQVGKQLAGLKGQGITAVSFGKTMEDISELSHSTLAAFKGNHKAMIASVIQARLLGTSLEKVKSQAMGTLDIESSIAKEMEARVLTGKNVNMEALRYAALTGDANDMLQAQTDVLKQIGTFDEIKNMNTITRQKQAEALGMTEDEMLDRSMAIHALDRLGEGFNKNKELSAKKLLELAENTNDETTKQYLNNQANVTAAKEWERTMTNLKEAFAPILEVVIDMAKAILPVVQGVATMAKTFPKILKTIVAIVAVWKLASMLGGKSMGGFAKGAVGKTRNLLGASGGAKGFTPRSVGMPKPSVPTPAGGGGGIMSGIKSMGTKAMSSIGSSGIGKMASRGIQGAQGLASSAVGAVKGMNPLKTLQKGLKGGGSKVLKGILKKIPFGSALFEMLFAGFDIASVMGDPNLAKGDKEQQIGSTVASSLGGVLGGAGLATLAQALNVLPGLGALVAPLAYMGGDFLGRKVGGMLAESMGAKPIGKTVMSVFGGDETALADGGMITKEINNATIGEAGPEAVVPLDKFYEKLDELKTAINHLGRRPILVKIGNNQSQQILSDGGYLNSIGNGLGI